MKTPTKILPLACVAIAFFATPALPHHTVGGLYGVHIGAAFFGESMFSRPELGGTDSSKVCLVHLVRWLRLRGFYLLDTQFRTEHLDQFGCVEIERSDYLTRLADAVGRPVAWGDYGQQGQDA